MSYGQFHYISTLLITWYPVHLSFRRHITGLWEDPTKTFSPSLSVHNIHVSVLHMISTCTARRQENHYPGEAVDRMKLQFIPDISVPCTLCVREGFLIVINCQICRTSAVCTALRDRWRLYFGNNWKYGRVSPFLIFISIAVKCLTIITILFNIILPLTIYHHYF